MPRRIVKQPNGLYAEFSTIVDTFTILNMTEDEAYQHCRREMGSLQAHEKVQRAVKDEVYYSYNTEFGDGTYRWEHDLDIVRDIHGDEEADKCLKLASIPEDEWVRMYEDDEPLPEGMEWEDFGAP